MTKDQADQPRLSDRLRDVRGFMQLTHVHAGIDAILPELQALEAREERLTAALERIRDRCWETDDIPLGTDGEDSEYARIVDYIVMGDAEGSINGIAYAALAGSRQEGAER